MNNRENERQYAKFVLRIETLRLSGLYSVRKSRLAAYLGGSVKAALANLLPLSKISDPVGRQWRKYRHSPPRQLFR